MSVAIGVIGANGQVGSEVCLFLRDWPGVRVVPICRNHFGSTLLRRAGLACRHGAVSSPESARELLEGCDLIADFSLPGGLATEVRSASCRTLENAILHGPARAPFVYASTMMAFGMPAEGGGRFRHHLFARTVYGANKRWAERCARRMARRAGRPMYALRIVQVHGELQAVSRAWLDALPDAPIAPSDAESYTVFAGTIAEALVQIATGHERPGTYTLVSSPPWTWREVHAHYCRRLGIEPPLRSDPPRASAARSASRALLERAKAFAIRRRDLATGYVLPRFPALEMRAMSWHHRRQAQAEITAMEAPRARHGDVPYSGPIPGARLHSLSDSRVTLEPRAEGVRALLRRIAEGAAAPAAPGSGGSMLD
jgi:nucleoside-diphosphate-sugar epimerase